MGLLSRIYLVVCGSVYVASWFMLVHVASWFMLVHVASWFMLVHVASWFMLVHVASWFMLVHVASWFMLVSTYLVVHLVGFVWVWLVDRMAAKLVGSHIV